MICLNCKTEIPPELGKNYGLCPRCGFPVLVLTGADVEKETNYYGLEIKNTGNESFSSFGEQIISLVTFLSLIPTSVWLWNIHPVLGILGIIFFCWLAKNKLDSGYYFG